MQFKGSVDQHKEKGTRTFWVICTDFFFCLRQLWSELADRLSCVVHLLHISSFTTSSPEPLDQIQPNLAHLLSHTNWKTMFSIFVDTENPYNSRFHGYSVYISNTTTIEDGKRCFKENTYGWIRIFNPNTITCPYHGRYVIYYNNRTHPYSDEVKWRYTVRLLYLNDRHC